MLCDPGSCLLKDSQQKCVSVFTKREYINFMVALVIAKNYKWFKCPSSIDWINSVYLCNRIFYNKENDATMWMYFINTVSNQGGRTQRAHTYDAIYYKVQKQT